MRIVIQRVSSANVIIDGGVHAAIGEGFLVLLGIESGDTREEADWLLKKLTALRVFNDDQGVMNLDVRQVGGQVLVISQFTLHASTRKGNRPSYIRAAREEEAVPMYEYFLAKFGEELPGKVWSGVFGADMKVGLVNDGPVTIIIDSRSKE